ECGRASDEVNQPIPWTTIATAGERGEERSGSPVGAKVSGLLVDVAPSVATQSCGEFGATIKREATGNLSPWAWTPRWPVNRSRTNTIAAWLDELLPAGRGEGSLRRTG